MPSGRGSTRDPNPRLIRSRTALSHCRSAAAAGCSRILRARIGAMRSEVRGGGLVFDIQVVPRSSRVAVGPSVGDRLRVAVTAPPVDGAANAAVIEALAAAFSVRRAAVSIVRGETGRRKTVRIEGGSAAVLTGLLGPG